MGTPQIPSSPSFFTMSSGSSSCSSRSPAPGAISWVANSRTRSRTCCCSDVSSNSMRSRLPLPKRSSVERDWALMSDVVTIDPQEAGREAYGRRAWHEAYRLLKEADGGDRLSAEDLEALAKSAWWIGQAGESIALF